MLIKRDVDGKAQPFPNGEVPAIIGTFTYTAKRMGGAPSITATIYYPTPLDKQWTHEEYVEFQGERYYATSIPSSSKDNQSVLYKHDVTFTSRREILDNTLFFDAVSNKDEDTKGGDKYRTNQTRFSFGGDITEFVSRINSSMKYCDVPYSVVIDDGYATTDVKEVSFENQYLTEVLQLINTTYQLDYYWVGNVCHVGKLQYDLTDNPIEYGRNDALVSVSKENSNARTVDMITGYGSSDNIPYYYPNDDEFGKADYISENINEPIDISLSQLQKNANIGADYAKKYTLYKREGALKATINIDGSFFGTMPSSELVVADGKDFARIAVIPIVAKKGMKIYEPKITVSHHTHKSGVSIKSDVFSFYMDNDTEGKYNGSYTFTNDRYAALVIWEDITIKSTIGDVAVDKSISYNYIGSVEIEYENQSKAFWLFDGGVIEYESSGISVNNIDNVTSAKSLVTFEKIPNADNTSLWWGFKETYDTSTEEAAAKITIKGRTWIFPSQNLMPSVYRESGGAERFYYAKNDTYSIPGATDKYTFKNIYKEGNPHQGSVEFSDIKPTINGVRNDVIQSDGLGQLFGEIAGVAFDSNDSDVKNDDSEYIHSYFYIKLHKFSGSYGFDLFKHALASESAKINLIKSNGCPACSFDIQCVPSKDKSKMYNCVSTDGHGNLKSVRDDCNDYIFKNDEDAYKDTFNQDSTKTELWIAVKKDDSTLGIIMPNASGNFKPQKGDLFVITGINPPKVLVTAAEKRLDDALIKYMSENNEDKFNYSVKFSRIFLQENMAFANKLNENSKVAITYAGEKHEFFVTNYTVKVDDSALADVEIELSDTLDASSSELKKAIDAVKGETVAQLQGLIGGSGGLNATIANRLYLSKQGDDTAQGLITFAKGLISDMLAKLKGGATFGKSGYKFDKDGNVVVDALSSLAFDEALERGFGVTKNAQGKYTLSVTDLMVWGKAVFNSLEIRKLYAVGGNVYLSGASSKIVRAVPVKKATDTGTTEKGDASETWVACAEGDADCEGWKCYTLNDDGTTATQNGWRKYDQAKCQTFDIEAGAHEGVSNTYYWRLVADVSTKNETITETRTEAYVDKDGVTKTREVTVDLYDGKKFGWVVLSKTDRESTTNDAPKAGDTIVLDGHRMFASGDADGRDQYNDESRTNVMMLETTGTENGTLPRIVALTGIVDYRHWDGVNQYSNTVFILSPKEVVFVSSSFKFMSASGDPITLVNFRGNWAKGTEYRYYDQVSHNDSIWTCIVKKGDTTNAEPSDTSTDWRKEISGGKGEKGDKGDPGTPGNGIDHVETRFFAWKSDKFGTGFDSDRVWEDGSTTMPADFSDDFPWLWQVTRTYYTNGTDVLGEAVCIGYKGKDAVTYGVQVTPYLDPLSSGKTDPGIQIQFTRTTGATVETFTNVTKLGGLVMVYVDGVYHVDATNWINSGNDKIVFSHFPIDNTSTDKTLGTASTIGIELLVNSSVVATANYANGKQGADGPAATVYTIEAVGNYNNNSGTLVDASTIGVTLTGDLKLYKTVGSEKTEDSKPPQCWRLTVGGKNVDGTIVFTNTAGNNIVTYQYYNTYKKDSNGNIAVPGSATISVYKDSSMGELLASLVIPITLNPGAIVNVDAKLGKIESTTASMKGTIETIQQGQGQISLKVQDLQNGGVDTSKPHTSSQVDFRALDADSFYPVMIRFKDNGGVRHTVEISRNLDGTYGSGKDYMTHQQGFSFRLIFSDIANGWGTNEDGQLHIESISQRWTEPTDTPICPKIAQYYPFSFTLAWLRGGSKYDITVDCTDAHISGIWPYMMQVASNPSWVPDAVRLAPDTWTTAQVNAQGGNPYNMLKKDNGGYYADVDNEYLYRFGELAAGNTFAIVGQPKDSKVWFLATWHITSVSGSKVYVDVSTYGLLWQAQNPLGIRMSELGYIKTGASYPKSTWDSQNGFGTSENVDNTAVHADWAVPRAILVIGKESSATNGVYRDRAVLEAVQSCTEGSSVSFYSNTYFDVSPLYGTDGRTNVKPDLLATGIDIKSHKIVATADNFIVRNNSGTLTFSIDEDGNIVGVGNASFSGIINATGGNFTGTVMGSTINGSTINGSTINSTSSDGKSTTKIEGGQITTNKINASGGSVSFFNFDSAGMYSGSIEQDGQIYSGLGMSMNNLSVSGNNNMRISSVFLGNGTIDSRFTNRTVYRVGSTIMGSTFYNYIKLERIGSGSFSFENSPEHAALGIETQGDFCLAALGGPSLFAGMCFASDTVGSSFTADKKHCFYLCSGGTFNMPSDPPDGMLIVVIQKRDRIDFNAGNGHRFQSGTYNSASFTSDSAGQWSLFYYNNGVWYTIYMTR